MAEREVLLRAAPHIKRALLSVWGGKITTLRKLAERAVDPLCKALDAGGSRWTRESRPTGGDLSGWIGASDRPDTDIVRFEQALAARHPELDARLRQRWTHAYGALGDRILAAGALGVEVAPGLFEAELRYLHDHEWARSADDVLWRRSKLGLRFDTVQREAVDRWWRNNFAADSEIDSCSIRSTA